MGKYSLAIIVPAFNEQENIGAVIERLLEYGQPIVVDDGSTDKTYSIALEKGALVYKNKKNEGYDAAINKGMKIAIAKKYQLLITFDADGQHPFEAIPQYIDKLEMGYSVICGIRNYKPRVAEKIFSFITSLQYNISDPLCGMKGYRVSKLKSTNEFSTYESSGTELLLSLVKNRTRFCEIPINVNMRKGLSRFGNSINGNLKIIRSLLFWYLGVSKIN